MSTNPVSKTTPNRNRYSSTVSITPHRIEVRASSTEELLTLVEFAFSRARDAGYLGPLGKRERIAVDYALERARAVDVAVGNLVNGVTS